MKGNLRMYHGVSSHRMRKTSMYTPLNLKNEQTQGKKKTFVSQQRFLRLTPPIHEQYYHVNLMEDEKQ